MAPFLDLTDSWWSPVWGAPFISRQRKGGRRRHFKASVQVIWVGNWRECYISCRSFEPSFHSRRNKTVGIARATKASTIAIRWGMKTTSTSRPTNGIRWIYNHAIHPLVLRKKQTSELPEPENFCTTTLVLRQVVLQTHRETQRASVTFEVRVGTRSDRVGPQGRTVPAGYPARTAHHRLKPMKPDLTLDHVKQEARDLLRGLQRRDSEALRRCHAITP